VERGFGLEIRKWGIFWRPLECAFDSVKIHNFGLDNKIEDYLCEEFDYVSTNIEGQSDNFEAVVITTSDGINRPNNLADVEENTGRYLFAEERRKAIYSKTFCHQWLVLTNLPRVDECVSKAPLFSLPQKHYLDLAIYINLEKIKREKSFKCGIH
jgi:hypothetical protein